MTTTASCNYNTTDVEVQSAFEYKLGPARRQAINVAVVCSSSLSLLGSGFILGSWVAFPQLRTPAFRLIVWLSASDWLHSLCYLVDGARVNLLCPDALCYVLAAWNQFFSLSTYLWTAAIAHNMYSVLVRTVHRGAHLKDEDVRLRQYHTYVWGASALLTAVAGAAGTYGLAGQWCWIDPGSQWARAALYFVPLLGIFVYNMVVYRRIGAAVQSSPVRSAVAFRLRFYLLIFFATITPSVANRAQNLLLPDSPSFVLYMLQSLLQPLLGLGNALVYGYNKRVRHAHARAWRRCARRCGWYGVDAVEAGGVLAQEAGSGAGSPGDDSGGRRGVAMAVQHVHVRGGGSLQEHDEHGAAAAMTDAEVEEADNGEGDGELLKMARVTA